MPIAFNNYIRSLSIICCILLAGPIKAQVVSSSVQVNPPYNIPVSELAEQSTLQLSMGRTITNFSVGWRISSTSGAITIGSKPRITDDLNLEIGINTFNGSDFPTIFNFNNVDFIGIGPNVYFDSGLPTGEYVFEYLIYQGRVQVSSARFFFSIDPSINVSTSITPPYYSSFQDLPYQVSVLINSNSRILRGFLRMTITGDNGVVISTEPSFIDRINIDANVPTNFSGNDLVDLFSFNNLILQNITEIELSSYGLPAGEYDICFQLFNSDGSPASGDAPEGCTSFSVNIPQVIMTAAITPPYSIPFADLSMNTTLSIFSDRKYPSQKLNLKVEGDNGISIETRRGRNFLLELPALENLVLTGSDLDPIFSDNNLIAAGISNQELFENGLPSGSYEFCFQLLDKFNNQLGQEACVEVTIENQVTLNLTIQPPYASPFDELSNQTNLLINSSSNISDATLQMELTGNEGVNITSTFNAGPDLDLIGGNPLNLTGADLDYYFSSSNLSIEGVSTNEIYTFGLPADEYELCFNLIDRSGNIISNGCSRFTVEEGTVNLSTSFSPPYEAVIGEWQDQTTVTINSNRGIADGLIQFTLQGDNGIQVQSDFLPLPLLTNEVKILGPDELESLFALSQLQIQGTTIQEMSEQGLPAGNYDYCFQYFYGPGSPATMGPPTGCESFTIQPTVFTISTIVMPPYEVPFEQLGDQVNVTMTSNRNTSDLTLRMELTSVDGAVIINSNGNAASFPFDLSANIPNAISADIISELFKSNNLSIQGVDEMELYRQGLPPGNYDLCISALDENGREVTNEREGCTSFNVMESIVTLTSSIIPPYNVPLPELMEQMNLSITSNREVSGLYMTMNITGDNGISLVTQRTDFSDLLSIAKDEMNTYVVADVFDSGLPNATITGIDRTTLYNTGFPSGNYNVCFNLFNENNEIITSERCNAFNIEANTIILSSQIILPVSNLFPALGEQVQVNAFSRQNTDIGLKMSITSDNGISIENNNEVLSNIVSLESQDPLQLMDSDLAPYFREENLVLGNISSADLFNNGLPEGIYEICFTGYDMNGIPLNIPPACSNFEILAIEPPILITPFCGTSIPANDVSPTIFSWMPSVGGNTETEYILKIVEMPFPERAPNEAILASTTPSFFETTVTGNSYLYGPADPIFEPGKHYAFVVYVANFNENQNFINDGISAACSFSIIEDQEEENDSIEIIGINTDIIKEIEINKFPGYFFPTSEVTGSLYYSYDLQKKTMKGLPVINPAGNQTISDGSNPIMSQMVKTHNYYVNQDPYQASKKHPLSNVKISLIKTYLLFGEVNGEKYTGHPLKSSDIMSGQHEFTDLVTGNEEVLATTTTDGNGNFDFYFISQDSLNEVSTPIDWSYGQGDIFVDDMDVSGDLYPIYRIRIESPYYCSPDINIKVQPWESVDLGEIMSRVNSYDLTVRVMRDPSLSYDYANSEATSIPGALTRIKRENQSIPYLPQIEGVQPDPDLSANSIMEDISNTDGYASFKNLVRHNANHPLDHYTIETETSENLGEYNFKLTETPYPVFPYHSLWECEDCPLFSTFHLPASINYQQPKFFQYNSEFEVESFYTEVYMKPEFPRVAGRVSSKTGEVLPSELSDEPPLTVSEASSTSPGNTFGGQLTTNASEQILMNFGSSMGSVPQWSNELFLNPMKDAKVNLFSVATHSQNNQFFTGKKTRITDANGKFEFNKLDMELEPVPADNTYKLQVVGPSRILYTEVPGFRDQYVDLGIMKWGDQRFKNFNLEPDGFIYGWVTDEAGNPMKADIFINDYTQTETVSSEEYQSLLGLTGPPKEIFIMKAPSGSNQELKIIPTDPGYGPATYTVDINENEDPQSPQSLGPFQVKKFKHRMKFRVMASLDPNAQVTKVPIKNALVKVTNLLVDVPEENQKSSSSSIVTETIQQEGNNPATISPTIINTGINVTTSVLSSNRYYAYTDENGYAVLSFENNADKFDIKVQPPIDVNSVSKEIRVNNPSSLEIVDSFEVILDPAFAIEGLVTYGTDSIPLNDARVYIDFGSELIQTFTDQSGYYNLKGIPEDQTTWTIYAENTDENLVLIGDEKQVTTPIQDAVNFHLEEFDEFDLSSLWGFPITIKSITQSNDTYIIDGAFINLAGNPNFKMKDKDERLPFYSIAVVPQTINNQLIGVPQQSEVEVDLLSLDLVNYTTFLANVKGMGGNSLTIKNNDGKGYLSGEVAIESNSFQFDDNYLSFNESQNESGSNQRAQQVVNSEVINNFMNINSINSTIQVSNAGLAFIDLFPSNESFYYSESQSMGLECTVFSVDSIAMKSYSVVDHNNDEYEYKIQDFDAIAELASNAYNDSIFLTTTLKTDVIPQMVPSNLEIEIGVLKLTKDGFDPLSNETNISFNIEDWEISVSEWTLAQHITGLQIHKGTLNTGLFEAQMKDFRILPNGFDKGSFDLNSFTFGGIVPVDIRSNFVEFTFMQECASDNKDHYLLAIAGLNGNEAAAMSGLPGMNSNDEILFESIYLYSNGDRELNAMGDTSFMFYDVLELSPDQFAVFEDGFEMKGNANLNIPRVAGARSGFRYTLNNGQVQSQFLGIDIDFTGLGHVRFVSSDAPGSQVLTQGNFDAMGTISDLEGIVLSGRLHKDVDSTYVIVDPLHQQLLIASDGSNKLIEITGDMHVANSDWDYFVFEGDMQGFKGVEENEDIRKTFIVKGDIVASGEAVGVKNIDVGFGEISIIYDIANARMLGHLAFEHSFSGLGIKGQVNFLADQGGWYFIAAGEVEAPGLGIFKAGLAIGDYNEMNTELETKLLEHAYNKNIPAGFENGFSGFLFTGNKTIPQLTIPKVNIDIGIASLSVEGAVGIDARLWMNFDDGDATFGIGVMAYAYIEMVLSAITCTDILGYISVELGVEGSYNTATKDFILQGCGSITVMGAISQCTPNPVTFSCGDPCLSLCESLAFRMIMEVSSQDGFDASMEMGNCSGNLPTLDEELGDTFNCN